MRKIFLSIIMLLTAIAMSAQKTLMNSEVNSQWRQKTISVKNGGQAPDVMTLLQAFHQALPTWVVGEVLKQQENPVSGTKRNGTTLLYENNEEDELRILIDPKNGYACYESLTDVDQMSCCVWRRSNGHRVFAISLYIDAVIACTTYIDGKAFGGEELLAVYAILHGTEHSDSTLRFLEQYILLGRNGMSRIARHCQRTSLVYLQVSLAVESSLLRSVGTIHESVAGTFAHL